MFKKLLALITISTFCLQAQASGLLRNACARTTVLYKMNPRFIATAKPRLSSLTPQAKTEVFWTQVQKDNKRASNLNLLAYAAIPVAYIASLLGHFI